MHYMGEMHSIEKLTQQSSVIYIAVDDIHALTVEEGLSGFFQPGLVVIVEIVEAHHAISPILQSKGNVGSDEAGGASDQNSEARFRDGPGRITCLDFPIRAQASPRAGGIEVAALSAGGGGGRGA